MPLAERCYPVKRDAREGPKLPEIPRKRQVLTPAPYLRFRTALWILLSSQRGGPQSATARTKEPPTISLNQSGPGNVVVVMIRPSGSSLAKMPPVAFRRRGPDTQIRSRGFRFRVRHVTIPLNRIAYDRSRDFPRDTVRSWSYLTTYVTTVAHSWCTIGDARG